MMKKKRIYIILFLIFIYNASVLLLFWVESIAKEGNIRSLADAYWYSIITLTTVGYGDFYPVTFWGRTIAFLFVLGSLGILGLLVTELSLAISNYVKKKKEGYFGTTMKNHCVIIGWDNFSHQVAEQIIKAQKELAIITNKDEDVDKINRKLDKENTFILLSEFNQYENFSKANIQSAERIYLNFTDDSETLVHTIHLKKMYPEATIVVALENMDLKSTFSYMGVDFVISKTEIASKLIASYIFEPNVAVFAEDLLATSNNENELDIWEHAISASSSFIGQNYMDLFIDFKKTFESVLLGVSRAQKIYKNPVDLEIVQDDILVFIADKKAYQKLMRKF